MAGNIVVKKNPSIVAVVHQMILNAPSGLSATDVATFAGYSKYNTLMSEASQQPGHKLGSTCCCRSWTCAIATLL